MTARLRLAVPVFPMRASLTCRSTHQKKDTRNWPFVRNRPPCKRSNGQFQKPLLKQKKILQTRWLVGRLIKKKTHEIVRNRPPWKRSISKALLKKMLQRNSFLCGSKIKASRTCVSNARLADPSVDSSKKEKNQLSKFLFLFKPSNLIFKLIGTHTF